MTHNSLRKYIKKEILRLLQDNKPLWHVPREHVPLTLLITQLNGYDVLTHESKPIPHLYVNLNSRQYIHNTIQIFPSEYSNMRYLYTIFFLYSWQWLALSSVMWHHTVWSTDMNVLEETCCIKTRVKRHGTTSQNTLQSLKQETRCCQHASTCKPYQYACFYHILEDVSSRYLWHSSTCLTNYKVPYPRTQPSSCINENHRNVSRFGSFRETAICWDLSIQTHRSQFHISFVSTA